MLREVAGREEIFQLLLHLLVSLDQSQVRAGDDEGLQSLSGEEDALCHQRIPQETLQDTSSPAIVFRQ